MRHKAQSLAPGGLMFSQRGCITCVQKILGNLKPFLSASKYIRKCSDMFGCSQRCLMLNLAGCWGPRQNVDSHWWGRSSPELILALLIEWSDWFWTDWSINNCCPAIKHQIRYRGGVSFLPRCDCHSFGDWLTGWLLIHISQSINQHSVLVKSVHCAAFDWSTNWLTISWLANTAGCSY